MDTRAKSATGKSKPESRTKDKSVQPSIEAYTSISREVNNGEDNQDTAQQEGEASSLDAIYQAIKGMDVKFSKKFDSIEKTFGELMSEVNSLRSEMKEENKKTGEKLLDFEKNLEFQADKVLVLEETQNRKIKEQDQKMRQRLHELEESLLKLEKNNRKYNLLLYGVEEPNGVENIYKTIKVFLKEVCKLESDYVDSIRYHHAHRLPGNSENTGPRPIIVRFVQFQDRENVYQKAFTLPKRKRILTDLPVVMKKERGRLAKKAYEIRQQEKLHTRIKESGLSVILQTRKNTTDEWINRKE